LSYNQVGNVDLIVEKVFRSLVLCSIEIVVAAPVIIPEFKLDGIEQTSGN